MNLELTVGERQAVAEARETFAAGGVPRVADRSITDLVVMAAEAGRIAAPVRFHSDVLAHLVGWDGSRPAAVCVQVGDGAAAGVHSAPAADFFLVKESSSRLRVLDRGLVRLEPQPTLDDPDCCRVDFTAAGALDAYDGLDVDIEEAVAKAALIRAADAAGAASAAFEWALSHVTTRTMRGAPLSDLQAVRHRLADMRIDVTVAMDAVLDAAGACDGGGETRLAIAYAKASAVTRSCRVTASAHQLAGGAGILEDAPLHRWFRRARAAALELGDVRRQLQLIGAALVAGVPLAGAGDQPR